MFRLKHLLASFLWFAAASTLLADYWRTAMMFERLYRETGMLVCFWSTAVPTCLMLPFILAGGFTLVGKWKCALFFGMPATAWAFYHAVFAVEDLRGQIRALDG